MLEVTDFTPLAAVQEHFWTADESALAAGERTECVAVRVSKRLDREALTVATEAVVRRNEILRTRVVQRRGEPMLIVDPPSVAPLTWVDEPQCADVLAETVRTFVESGICPVTGPVLRLLAVPTETGEQVLVCAVHHMIADATAVRCLMDELAIDYAAAVANQASPVPLPELQYADYVTWEREELLPTAERHDAPWWRNVLDGAPQRLDLRLDRPRPAVKGSAGRREEFRFSEDTRDALLRYCRASKTTPYAVSLAAFAALVTRSTGAQDMLIGVLSAGRPVPQLERMIGQFANTLPLRLCTENDPDLDQLVLRCSEAVAKALDHSMLPLSRIVRLVRASHDPSSTALVQHLVLPALRPMQGWTIDGAPTETYEVERRRGRFDTIVEVDPGGVRVEYDTALYTHEGISALIADYQTVLSTWLAAPAIPLSRLPLNHPASVAPAGRIPDCGHDTTVTDVPIPVAALETARAEGQRVLRRVRLADGGLLVLDITEVPRSYPLVVTARPGVPERASESENLSLLSPAPLEVLTEEGEQLLTRWSPCGELELVSGVELVAFDSQAQDEERATAAGDRLLAVVTALWQEVLGQLTVDPDDDFFECGGHSMTAARLVAELGERLGMQVKVRTLFEHPSPRMLSSQLREDFPGVDDLLALVESEPAAEVQIPQEKQEEPSDDGRVLPMLSSQRQIWLAQQSSPRALTHTIPLLLRIRGEVEPAALTDAVIDVVRRQPGLRATFGEEEGEPVQRIAPFHGFTVPIIDLRDMPEDQRARENALLERETAYGGFDIATGPLLRAQLVRVNDREHVLHLLFHHLVTDEVSMTLFMRELSAFYRARLEGCAPELVPLTASFNDVIRDEQAMLAGVEGEKLRRFWARALAGAPLLHVPVEGAREQARPFVGEFLKGQSPPDLKEALSSLARATRATSFTVFCSAVITLLGRMSGQEDVVIGVPTDNRTRPGSEQLIGCFLNVVPVRVDLAGDPSFEELVARVQEALLRSYDHQRLPFAEIVDAVHPERVPGMHPIYQVTCELQLSGWLPVELPGCTVTYDLLSHGTARYDMSFHALVYPDDMSVMLELNTDLWTQQTGLERIASVTNLLYRAAESPGKRLSQLDGMVR